MPRACAPVSPGERHAKDYQINYLRCIMCGLCVEACKFESTGAIRHTREFEGAAPMFRKKEPLGLRTRCTCAIEVASMTHALSPASAISRRSR